MIVSPRANSDARIRSNRFLPPVDRRLNSNAHPTRRRRHRLLAALPAELATHRDELERRLAELERADYSPPPLVTGDDLTAAGLTPSPLFKRVLDEVYDAQLENRVTTKDEALRLALAIASRPPAT